VVTPTYSEPLLAGSRSRGRGAPGSDYDVILLFGELPNGAWRETSTFEEQVIETFAHDRPVRSLVGTAADCVARARGSRIEG
jgi:hypothetical protein